MRATRRASEGLHNHKHCGWLSSRAASSVPSPDQPSQETPRVGTFLDGTAGSARLRVNTNVGESERGASARTAKQ